MTTKQQNNSNPSDKKYIIESDWLKIALTAVITSLLTLSTSYFIMSSQLSKEQDYWKSRKRIEGLQALSDRQIKLFEDINSQILLIEVLSKDFKLESAKFKANIELYKTSKNFKNKVDESSLENKAVEYHKQINLLGSKLQMATLFFGKEVDSLIIPLNQALELNYNNNLILNDSNKIQGLESTLDYFKHDFNTISLVSDNRLKFLGAMIKDINSVTTYLYKEK